MNKEQLVMIGGAPGFDKWITDTVAADKAVVADLEAKLEKLK